MQPRKLLCSIMLLPFFRYDLYPRQHWPLPKGWWLQTFVHVLLLGKLVVRVAISVYGPIQLLKGHQSCDQLIISVKESSKPLLCFHVLDLLMLIRTSAGIHINLHSAIFFDGAICRTRSDGLRSGSLRSALSHD
jgi:hypothetical protein